jgi:hypothetical protein
MSRSFSASALLYAALIAAALSAPAHASTVTYDITLTQTSGTLLTGSDFSVTSTPFTITVPAKGFLQDTPTVSFTIGGATYTSTLDVQFNGPTITNIYGFSNTENGDTLSSIGLTSFQLYGAGIGSTIGGTVSMQPAPAVTPIPATLPLFATGLAALGLLAWSRKRRNVASLAA